MRKLHFWGKSLLLSFLFLLMAVFAMQAEVRILYSTNFQDWADVANPATEVSINKTTSFTNETLTFKLLKVSVQSTKYDAAKFNYNIVSTGALMAEKMPSAGEDLSYIQTTPISSIKQIFVVIGATGSNRGYKIYKKADGDADWVAIYSAVANPANGDSTTIAIPGGQTNVALKFTNLAYAQNAYLFDLKIWGEYATTAPQQTLYTSINLPGAGTVTKSPNSVTYDQNSSVDLIASENFGYHFVNWIDSVTSAVLSTNKTYSVTMDADKHIQAVYSTVNTYKLTANVQGGAKSYMLSASPAAHVVSGNKMYEDGTNVTITANSNPILTFTNWGSGETGNQISYVMNEDKTVTAMYSAVDYIAGWDFYNTGASSRAADFYSKDENQTSSLILRNDAGTLSSWLDKSQVAAMGYEGRASAVNWKNLTDHYYYQISFDASSFTGISVLSAMLLNYNAYSVQKVEYSLDNITFTTLDQFTLATAKTWYEKTVTLPAECDHAAKVYVRWIPDYTSEILGTTATNDGTAISGIYVFATESAVNDGIAPVLSSSVPASGGTGASATGKVVLNFDEKIQIAGGTTASLGSKTLTPSVSGKTITFSYSGLDYNTVYTFTLPANTVSDIFGNTLLTAVSFSFTTANRPVVTKKVFDFVVGVDGDFAAAKTAAQTAASSGNRFYIFFPNGQYNIGTTTGDANQMTTISTPKLSMIGQSGDSVVLYNQSITESINSTATMYFTSASSENYMQDLSLMNKMDYRTGTLLGRGVALWDQGNKNIYKGVKLLSNQDTYYTGGAIRSYLENCDIHGTVDFICGGGDIFFNECLLYLEERAGNCLTAPATTTNWGYVFNNCTIDGFEINNNGYRLGRPWSNAPKAVYLNTKMKVLPAASAWGDPMNVVPAVFAEYNSMTSTGSVIDLSNRRTTYTKDATTVILNPVLTSEQAATYSIENVVGSTDTWQPNLYTDQAAAPVVSRTGRILSWDNNNYVLCWAVFKNNTFVQFTTGNSYSIPAEVDSAGYTIRAANEMGGLSESSNVVVYTNNVSGIDDVKPMAISQSWFTPDGKRIYKLDGFKGTVIVRTLYADGSIKTTKMVKVIY